MVKTTCTCGVCGKQIYNKAEWRARFSMHDHIKADHFGELTKMREHNEELQGQIHELSKKKYSLYTVENRDGKIGGRTSIY